jgi:hypothetical protein
MAYSAANRSVPVSRDHDDKSWYEIDKSEETDVATALFNEVSAIEEYQPYVLENYRSFFEKYSGYSSVALTWKENTTLQRPIFTETRGLIRAACETATALISQHMPKATVMSEGASFELLRQAADLDLFLVGAYYAAEVYKQFPQIFRDSTICGTGTAALIPEGSGETFRVRLERVFPAEVVVPEYQCESNPKGYTERYRVMRWPKSRIRKEYGEVPFDRENAYCLTKRGNPGPGMVWVIEAFHISGKDRRRVLATPSAVLEDNDWPHDFFPYVDLWWQFPPSGFYGDGIAYRQYAKQERIDQLHKLIHKGQNLFLMPRIFNGPGAPPQAQQVSDVGTFVSGRSDPKVIQQQAFGAEMYNWLETLYRAGLEDEGISQSSAGNFLPPGLESAPAQQEHSFKEAQRFAPVSLRYETTIAEETATKLIAMYAYEANGDGAKPRTKVFGRSWVQCVDWPDVDMERDAFHIRVGASSLETLSPSGRVQAAMNMIQMGLVNPARARMLIGHPDLEYDDRLATASQRYCEAYLSACMRGERPPIDDLTDLVELRTTLSAGYNYVASIAINDDTHDVRLAQKTIELAILELDQKEQELMAQAQAQQAPTDVPVPDSVGSADPSNIPPGPTGVDPGAIPEPVPSVQLPPGLDPAQLVL